MATETATRVSSAEMEPGIYLRWPVQGRVHILQRWGENPGYYMRYRVAGVPLRGHNGLDLALEVGSPILAADRGRVIEIGHDREGWGRFLRLEHRWGESLYAHLQGFAVEVGQWVAAGDLLAYSGAPSDEGAPHLHFGIRAFPYHRGDGWGGYTNPEPFLVASVSNSTK